MNTAKSAMAEGPDPRLFASWEEAFKYPIASVRGMERQLRNDTETNKERLRTLVGYVAAHRVDLASLQSALADTDCKDSTSYRDLLGTAESIVEMDKDILEVERLLGKVAIKCNVRAIDRKVTNVARWEQSIEAKGTLLEVSAGSHE